MTPFRQPRSSNRRRPGYRRRRGRCGSSGWILAHSWSLTSHASPLILQIPFSSRTLSFAASDPTSYLSKPSATSR
jgi:hypothetical protein